MSRTYEGLMEKAVKLIKRQYDDCIDQTGCEPCDEDYLLYMESEEWQGEVGDINIEDLISFVVNYGLITEKLDIGELMNYLLKAL